MGEGSSIPFADDPAGKFVDRRNKVWLECSGDPVDYRSVVVVAVREPARGVEVIRFVCPRCGKPHESLRFR